MTFVGPHARADAPPNAGAPPRVVTSRDAAAAVGVLLLAAINLFVRLGHEVVTDWDEALYAITAWEALQSGEWIGTTFLGRLDYYNSKPPLNVWLIGASFSLFGPGLVSLRIASALAAWVTVAVLMAWARRLFDPLTALLAGLVLSTTFGFLYVHAGRSGNADALLALLMLLVAVTLWAESDRPWRRVWLGPLLAGVFLLKGMAVLMALLLVASVVALRPGGGQKRLLPSLVAVLLFAAPCAAWMAARWRIDRSAFLETMVRNDLFRLSTEVLEGHAGSPLFYLDVLQKHHYDWLAAAVFAVLLVPVTLAPMRQALVRSNNTALVLTCWAAVCFLVPTLLQTKLAWYLNPFYPAFALGVGWILARALVEYSNRPLPRRRIALGLAVTAFLVAEGKLVWYSFQMRDVDGSVQGLLLGDAGQLAQARIYRTEWGHADRFVAEAIVRAEPRPTSGVEEFLERSSDGDYLVHAPGLDGGELELVRRQGEWALYRRTTAPRSARRHEGAPRRHEDDEMATKIAKSTRKTK